MPLAKRKPTELAGNEDVPGLRERTGTFKDGGIETFKLNKSLSPTFAKLPQTQITCPRRLSLLDRETFKSLTTADESPLNLVLIRN